MTTHASSILTVGMIGVAGFGAHRRWTMRRTGLFRVAACCDRNPAALKQACGEESARPVSGFDELLSVPGLEAVVVSTGVDTHADLAIAAMERRLHVFVEKPLCGRIEEVHRLRQAQRRRGVVVGVGHTEVASDWIVRTVQSHLEQGALSEALAMARDAIKTLRSARKQLDAPKRRLQTT